jgi:hypothetical protein
VDDEDGPGLRREAGMFVYITRQVTRDGYIIKHVCATPERAIELSLGAGHKYLLTGDADRPV